ncbi:hypothetical protein Tco_0812407, partial [Tanacetum coccineum]
NMDSSMGNICLGKDVIEISSDRNEGLGDWDSPEYKDTAGTGGKKEPEALVFHKMYTKEDIDCDEEGKPNLDELKTLLDFDFDEVLQTEIDLPPMVCKCGMGDCKMDEKKGNWKSEGQLDLLWVLITHLVMLSPNMTNTTSSTIRNSHHNSNMMMRRTSSVG